MGRSDNRKTPSISRRQLEDWGCHYRIPIGINLVLLHRKNISISYWCITARCTFCFDTSHYSTVFTVPMTVNSSLAQPQDFIHPHCSFFVQRIFLLVKKEQGEINSKWANTANNLPQIRTISQVSNCCIFVLHALFLWPMRSNIFSDIIRCHLSSNFLYLSFAFLVVKRVKHPNTSWAILLLFAIWCLCMIIGHRMLSVIFVMVVRAAVRNHGGNMQHLPNIKILYLLKIKD